MNSSLLSLSLLLLLRPPATEAGEEGHHRLRGRSLQAPAPCALLTQSVFDALAPGVQSPPYSYAGFCAAATGWNAANPAQQIFATGTEEDQREELAAFLGHTLHESGDFVHPRELSQCSGPVADGDGDIYCRPDGFVSGTYDDPYCDPRGLTPGTDPDGCACFAVSDTDVTGRLKANLLFFGRGPMQLSWNYNYIDAGNALGVDLCAEPELVATDEATAWGTAIWFWMQNTGATGVTPHDAIVTNVDFGASLNTINGGIECPAASGGSVISRLDDYCRAASALGLASLLSFDGCDGLKARYTECLGASTCPNCEDFGDTTTSPSKSPTRAIPSTSPTNAPKKPTISPTTNSSKSPSISPTEAPTTSVNPAASQITSTPSGSPTRASSKSPSTSPAKAPTISPTPSTPAISPTRDPLKSPSTPPTKAPTINPSTPTSSRFPTTAASKSPLTLPTKAPTTDPSTSAPSGSSTPTPTRSPAPCLFYTNRLTCVNDCSEEGWNTMHDTLEECCTAHYSYVGQGGYNDCAGITESPTTSPTANPLKSPSPMEATRNPNTPAPSVSPTPDPTRSPSPCLFYTNWLTCINDCNEEDWDTLYDTREECCSARHTWSYTDCIGSTESPTASPTVQRPLTAAPTRSPNTPSPSVSPTPAPTRFPTPCLFYTNDITCINDCNEEGWNTLHGTLEACCTTHHNWIGAGGFIECMGITMAPTQNPNTPEPSVPPTRAPTRSPSPCLFYTNRATCVNDCNEEGWNTLHGTLEDCCTRNHNWIGAGGYIDCMGITLTMAPTESPNIPEPSVSPNRVPTQIPTPCLFYSDGAACVNDCNQEGWNMLHGTLEECCTRHHSWVGAGGFLGCMGITGSPTRSPTATPSKSPLTTTPTQSPNSLEPSISPTRAPTRAPSPCLFYTNYNTCVKDCNEESWDTLHTTLDACCAKHHFWVGAGGYNDCMGITGSPATSLTSIPSKSPISPTALPSLSPNTPNPNPRSPSLCLFYTNGSTCVNDCNEAADGWLRPTYSSLEECCNIHFFWLGAYQSCMGLTNSPTLNPTTTPSKSPSSSPIKGPTASPSTPPTQSPAPCLYYTNGTRCVNDCGRMGWMPPLYTNLQSCCDVHHFWLGAYQACMGTSNSPTKSPTPAPSQAPQPCQFYSDWSGTCVNDCNEGDFPPPMHASLEACCLAHYTWSGAYETCTGVTSQPSQHPAPSPMDTSLFYVDWNIAKCVQNCEVSLGVPCGGIREEYYVQKHENVQQCCKAHLSWLCPESGIPCTACTDADISAWTR